MTEKCASEGINILFVFIRSPGLAATRVFVAAVRNGHPDDSSSMPQPSPWSAQEEEEEVDSDLENDLRVEEDQLYRLGNAKRHRQAQQRSATLASVAANSGAPWAPELAKYLASELDVSENKADAVKAYGHSRGEAEVVIKAIHERTKKMVENKENYVSLILYLGSLILLLVVLYLQRKPADMFKVEESVRNGILSDTGGLADLEGNLDGFVDSIDDIYTFISSALITPSFKDAVCGDGLCQSPQEHASFGRFGCAQDCGTYPQQNMTKIVINLAAAFDNEENRTRARWNLNLLAPGALADGSDSVTQPAFRYFASDQVFTSLTQSVTHELYLIDGNWRLEIEAWKGAVTGSIYTSFLEDERNTSSTTTLIYDSWESCLNTTAERATVDKVELTQSVRSHYRPNAMPCCPAPSPGPGPGPGRRRLSNGVSPETTRRRLGTCISACSTVSCTNWYDAYGTDYADACGSCTDTTYACHTMADDFFPFVVLTFPHTISDCFKAQTSSSAECIAITDSTSDANDATCNFRNFRLSPPTGTDINTMGFLQAESDFLGFFTCFSSEEIECIQESGRKLFAKSDSTTPWCNPTSIGDGVCDESCNFPKCNMDGGDCPGTNAQLSNVCADKCVCSLLGDDTCDADCNNAACGFDAGDCCAHLTYETHYKGKVFVLNARNMTYDHLDTMLPVPMLERLGNSNARMRVFGNLNRIIAGILVTQVRAKGDTSCGAGVQTFPHKFPNLMPTCTIREGKRVVDTLPFGVDPMFVSQASIYSHSVAVNAEEYYGKAQEHADLTFNEQGIPWGFQNGENGYPIFFDINLEESRAALMMNYMKEGNYLSSISGSNASSTDQVDVRFVVYNGNYKVRDVCVCVCVCGVDGGTLLFSISPSTTLTSLLFLSSPLLSSPLPPPPPPPLHSGLLHELHYFQIRPRWADRRHPRSDLLRHRALCRAT